MPRQSANGVLAEPDDPGSALRQAACEVGHFRGIAGRDEKNVDDYCLLVTCYIISNRYWLEV